MNPLCKSTFHIIRQYNNTRGQIYIFGLVMFINYPLYYYIFDHSASYADISIIARSMASFLCIPLIFERYFYSRIETKIFLALYWYLAITFCLPFFFVFMTLINHGAAIWVMNLLCSIFFMLLLLDVMTFFILMILGSIFAYLAFKGVNEPFYLDIGTLAIWDVMATIIAAVIIGSIFSRYKAIAEAAREMAVQKIEAAYRDLDRLVAERTAELKEALNFKTMFLNNMSHEVKTPVQGICGISEGLVEHWEKLDEAKRYDLANKVAQNARRLVSLTSSLLDLSRITAGKMTLSLQEMDLLPILHDMAEEAKDLYIQDKKISIKINQMGISSAIALIDHEKILQVLRNILNNSVKFMASGNITINTAITNDGATILIEVRDEGVGIPHDELAEIFESFAQSSRTRTRAGGTGLGLAICKEIIELHNGKIWAENNNDGGSKFSFELPIIKSDSATDKDASEKYSIAGKAKMADNQSNLTILMIDDEESCLISMEMILMDKGYNLVLMSDGREALNYLKENHDKVDIILLDLMMPTIYGLDVLSEIKMDSKLDKIPVIVQSGTGDTREINKVIDAGASAIMMKPYNKRKVLELIDSVSKLPQL